MNTSLYYECHITIDPVFNDQRELAAKIAGESSFKLAELLMQKRQDDTPEQSKYDTFMTGHSKDYGVLHERMVKLLVDLRQGGFKARRYKIEDILIDSRIYDQTGLLAEK